MRRLFKWSPLLAVVVVLGIVSSALATGKTVSVGDNFFGQATGVPVVTVKKGDSVTWKWVGKKPHNVVAKGPASFSSPVKTGGTFSKVLIKPGTYNIVCTIHGAADMSMKVVVK